MRESLHQITDSEGRTSKTERNTGIRVYPFCHENNILSKFSIKMWLWVVNSLSDVNLNIFTSIVFWQKVG